MGIEPAYHEKVFGLFERLSSDGDGTGIGLSLAKRIVVLHQGRIWVQSKGNGPGTMFCFTLPSKDASFCPSRSRAHNFDYWKLIQF